MAHEATSSSDPDRYVGQSIKRVEDPRLLRGQARYVDDIVLPRMVHAAFVRSPYPHARIVAIDSSRAEALPGVVAVFTGEDLASLGPIVATAIQREELIPAARMPLPADKARFVGDAVAVVVATSPYIAEDGRDLVEVQWEPLEAVLDPEEALRDGAPLVDEALESNNVAHIQDSVGDVEKAFAEADHVFEKRFRVGRSTGAPIEGRGVVAEYEDRGGGRMIVHPSSQMPHLLRMLLAAGLGMQEGRITVRVPDVGGAFGLTCTVFPEDIVIPAIARELRRPVKWIEDRWENLATSAHSKGMIASMEIAVDDDGTLKGFRAHFISDAGAYVSVPFTPLCDTLVAGTMLPSLYAVEDVAYTADNPLTNKCMIGPIRGVGWTPAQIVRETLIDDISRALQIDPIELRLKNMLGPQPHRAAFGASYDGGSYKQALELVRDELEYDSFRDRQATLREEGRHIGIGFSPFVEPTGWAAKTAKVAGFPSGYFDTASVTMEPDGSVTVTTGFHSHGQGHETTFAQVAADQMGVPMESVRVEYGDTDTSAFGMGTYASRSAVIGTGSISNAAAQVKERLRVLAAGMLEASTEDIEIRNGEAVVAGAPARAVPLGEVAMFGYFGGELRPEEVQSGGLTATAAYDSEETYANGCTGAIVEVDVDTGLVTLQALVACEDCGIVLNPMIVKGQVAGAVSYGIGMALLEDLVYDEDGEFVSGSLLDYLFPTTMEVPMLGLHSIETPSATTGGVKGVGEAGAISTPPAILNAVADALSPFEVKVERSPVTPMYVRRLLREAGVTKVPA